MFNTPTPVMRSLSVGNASVVVLIAAVIPFGLTPAAGRKSTVPQSPSRQP